MRQSLDINGKTHTSIAMMGIQRVDHENIKQIKNGKITFDVFIALLNRGINYFENMVIIHSDQTEPLNNINILTLNNVDFTHLHSHNAKINKTLCSILLRQSPLFSKSKIKINAECARVLLEESNQKGYEDFYGQRGKNDKEKSEVAAKIEKFDREKNFYTPFFNNEKSYDKYKAYNFEKYLKLTLAS